jgi:hypothetical protein
MGANLGPGYQIMFLLAKLKLITNGNMSTHPGLEFPPNSRIPFLPDVKIAMPPLVLFKIVLTRNMATEF